MPRPAPLSPRVPWVPWVGSLQSGGLEEVLTLPFLMVLPGIVLGTLGGLLGAAVNRLRSA